MYTSYNMKINQNSSIEDYIYGARDLYRKLPSPIRNIAGKAYRRIPIKLRFGSSYTETINEISNTTKMSKSEIEEYQLERLNLLLQHCIKHVPYYKNGYGQVEKSKPIISSLDDLQLLPLLNKELVRKHNNSLIADNIPSSDHLHMNTGGSTGIPLDLYYEKGVSRAREWAFIHDIWKRASWKEGDRTVMLRGWTIPRGKYWQFEPIRNRLIMSAFHLNKETIPMYLQEIRKFQPKFIEAYPSNISIVADYMIRNNLPPIDSIVAILPGSENLFTPQRELIQKAFNCRILGWYGHGEISALGGECECSTDYHMFPSYGITELVDASNNSITKPGVLGEIVATGFNNNVMPLVRYKTGDMGVLAEGSCQCGRQWQRLSKVEGRKQELVVTADGKVITLTALVFGQHYKAFSNIIRMQLAQKVPGEIVIRIEPSEMYSVRNDEKDIKRKIDDATESSFKVSFEYPDSISRTARGKHIFLEQALKIDEYLS